MKPERDRKGNIQYIRIKIGCLVKMFSASEIHGIDTAFIFSLRTGGHAPTHAHTHSFLPWGCPDESTVIICSFFLLSAKGNLFCLLSVIVSGHRIRGMEVNDRSHCWCSCFIICFLYIILHYRNILNDLIYFNTSVFLGLKLFYLLSSVLYYFNMISSFF